MIVLNSTTKNPQGLYAEMYKQWSEFLKSLKMNRGNIGYKELLSPSSSLGSVNYIQKIREKIKHHYFYSSLIITGAWEKYILKKKLMKLRKTEHFLKDK